MDLRQGSAFVWLLAAGTVSLSAVGYAHVAAATGATGVSNSCSSCTCQIEGKLKRSDNALFSGRTVIAPRINPASTGMSRAVKFATDGLPIVSTPPCTSALRVTDSAGTLSIHADFRIWPQVA